MKDSIQVTSDMVLNCLSIATNHGVADRKKQESGRFNLGCSEIKRGRDLIYRHQHELLDDTY